LITQLERRDERDEVALESLWVSALSSHARRCFRPRANAGWVFSVTDRSETGLKGDVVNRHDLLGKLRDFYVNGPANPVRRSPPARHRQTRHRQRTARCTEP